MESIKIIFDGSSASVGDTLWHTCLAELLAIGVEVALLQPFRVVAAERMVGCSKQGLAGTALRVYKRDGPSGLWKAGWSSAARQLAERCMFNALSSIETFELLTATHVVDSKHNVLLSQLLRESVYLCVGAAALAPIHCAEQRLLVQHARREHAALPKYRHGVVKAAAMIRNEEGPRALFAHVPSAVIAAVIWLAASAAVSRVQWLSSSPRWYQWLAARALVAIAVQPALLVATKMASNAHTVPPTMRPQVVFATSIECVTEVVATHSLTGLWAGLFSLGVTVIGGTMLKCAVRHAVASLLRSLPDPPP